MLILAGAYLSALVVVATICASQSIDQLRVELDRRATASALREQIGRYSNGQ